MSEASLAAQRLAVASMRARSALLDLVPALNIFDRHSRPEIFPCIIVGEAQTVGNDTDCFDLSDVFLTIHVWAEETGFVRCKEIAGEVRRALRGIEGQQDGFELTFTFGDATYLRDRDGIHSHGVLTFEATAEDLS